MTLVVSFDPRRRTARPGELALVRGPRGVEEPGLITEVARHGSGFDYCRVVRSAASCLYWVDEVTLVGTFREEAEKRGSQRTSFRKFLPADPAQAFAQFRSENWDNLDLRGLGKATEVTKVHSNAVYAVGFLRDTAEYLTRQGVQHVPERLDYGSMMVLLAGQIAQSALLLHLRENQFNENATLVVLRSALDALGTAAAFMFGPRELLLSWNSGDWVRWSVSLPFLRVPLTAKRPDAPDPDAVYTWLSKWAHFTKAAAMANHSSARRDLHADAYAALSYVAWVTAVMAEVASGYDDIATWPERWPDPLPWA